MIGTIRKHSALLWWTIIPITILSFVWYMGKAPSAGRGSGPGGSYGVIYGHEVTAMEFDQARRDFELFYLINYGEWPEKNRNITDVQMEQQTYVNLMFEQKAKSLGVAIPDDSVADAASQILHSQSMARAIGANGPIPMDKFIEQVLKPRNLSAGDFEHAVRAQLTVEQMRLTMGLSGSLVTPQEAVQLYDEQHREAYAQAVFFSASNYLSSVTVTPEAVAQFFTNNMAYYRLPERVQVSYVWFNISNYVEAVKAESAKTNFEQQVDKNYQQFGTADEFKNLKPEEAKAKIRGIMIQKLALNEAGTNATAFKTALYAMDPVKPENIATLAKQFGLTAHTSAPFAEGGQPEEFVNAPNVVRAAFTLNSDTPYSDLIVGEDGIYLIGLANQLPSGDASFTDIQARVRDDFRMQSAYAMANRAGTNFYATASVQMAAGKTFAQAAVAEAQTPVILAPFSLSSTEVPEATGHADIRVVRQAAFTTAPGHITQFTRGTDGGFVLYLQKIVPVDASKNPADLASFTSQVRRNRENDAFNLWVNSEATRELHSIPAFQKQSGSAN